MKKTNFSYKNLEINDVNFSIKAALNQPQIEHIGYKTIYLQTRVHINMNLSL